MNRISKFDDLQSEFESVINKSEEFINQEILTDIKTMVLEILYKNHELILHNEQLTAAQDKLYKINQKLFDLYHLAPIVFLTLQPDLSIIEINITGAELFGIDNSKLNLLDFSAFISPEFHDLFSMFCKSILNGTKTTEIELKLLDKAKSPINAQIYGYHSYGYNSNLINLVIIETEKWFEQLELNKKYKERFEMLMNLPEPVLVHKNGDILFANNATAELFDRDNAEFLIGTNVVDYIVPGQKEIINTNIKNRLAGKRILNNYETQIIVDANTHKTVIINASLVAFDEEPAFVVALRDITQISEKREELNYTNTFNTILFKIRALPQNTSEYSLFQSILDLIVENYNIEFASLFMIDQNEYKLTLNSGYADVRIHNLIIRLETAVAPSGNNDTDLEILDKELMIIDKNGKTKSKESLNSILGQHNRFLPFFIDNELIAIVFIKSNEARNINKRVISDVLLEINDVSRIISEKKATESKYDDIKNQINITQMLLNKKNQYIANVCSELIGILNPIQSSSSLLQTEYIMPSGITDIISLINSSAEKLHNSLYSIADLAKADSGIITIESENVDLFKLLESIINKYKQIVSSTNYTFQYKLSSKLPQSVISDEQRLKQILEILLNNAIANSHRIGSIINFEVDTYNSNHNGFKSDTEYISFAVSDEGYGYDDDQVGSLFDLNANIKRNSTISATELSLANRITELMHGKLNTTSVKGLGSKFVLNLPFVRSKTNNIKSYSQSNKRILVAEDDVTNISLLKAIFFHNTGYDLTIAKNGLQALDFFKKNTYDIVLMDLKMPLMSGEEATKLIREYEEQNKLPATPIIGVTAKGGQSSKANLLELGMSDVIFKPYINSELLALIEEYIR